MHMEAECNACGDPGPHEVIEETSLVPFPGAGTWAIVKCRNPDCGVDFGVRVA